MPDPRIFPIVSALDTFAAAGFASVVVLPAHARRGDADITNDGDYVIYLARGHAAVVGSGQRLNPKGGTYHIGTNNLFKGDIHAIADCEEQEECNLAISEGYQQ